MMIKKTTTPRSRRTTTLPLTLPLTRTLTLTLPLLLLPLCSPIVAAQTTVSCSTYSSFNTATPTAITGLTAASSTVTLANTVSTGQLCLLYATEAAESGSALFYIPVGRSYDGHAWERAAGRYDTLSYDCTAGGSCTVTLPDVDALSYYVVGYSHSLTAEQTAARFFEKATFGPTSSLLSLGASMAASPAAAADWIADQMDESATPASSHREHYRQRLNPRSLEVYKYGKSGPHPCDADSRWRTFAFTRKDAVLSRYVNLYWPSAPHNATLEGVSLDGGTTHKYLWRFAGHVRTVLDARPLWGSGAAADSAIADGSYPVCTVDELPGSAYASETDIQMYARFVLQDASGDCQHVKGGNPDVSFDAAYLTSENDALGPYHLDLTGESSHLSSVGHIHPPSVSLFRNPAYRAANPTRCESLPDPRLSDSRSVGSIYSPFYEGFKHPNWDNSTRDYLDPPVFASLPDGSHALHDRRLVLLRNTIDDPLPDGGGTQTLESVFYQINDDQPDDSQLLAVDVDDNPRTPSLITGNENGIFCSNSIPNVFNEAHCQLSTEPTACTRNGQEDEDTIVVTTLNAAVLDKINGYVTANTFVLGGDPYTPESTNLYYVHGLEFTANTNLPCQVGKPSRWLVLDTVTTKAACDMLGTGGVVAGSGTYAAFENLLFYSVGDNDVLRDVVMYEQFAGMGCDAADETKSGFAVFVTDLDTCFLNVHPQEYGVYSIDDPAVNVFGSSGALYWSTTTDASLTMTAWETKDNSQYTYYGRVGDVVALEDFMDQLEIYSEAGGKDRTRRPTHLPSASPSYEPSESHPPTTSTMPSEAPTDVPSSSIVPSASPTLEPSSVPSTSTAPSSSPSASIPPSAADAMPSDDPSLLPSAAPSESPTVSDMPSSLPTRLPSSVPTSSTGPTTAPTSSEAPTPGSESPSASPSASRSPSANPTESAAPSQPPSIAPSSTPTESAAPSSIPSASSVPSLPPTQISDVARTINDNVFDTIINDPTIARVVLTSEFRKETGGVLVCGSEGEIEPDPALDDYFDNWNRRLDSSGDYGAQKKTVWTNLALTADDQLRQRMAFALSQIFAVSPAFLAYSSLSEQHMYYYDIFVRNAFGTYRDVLKRVAFSSNMGRQLSHSGSMSVRTGMDSSGVMRFPDENYAREVMQLETIGLELLEADGTVILDRMGRPVPTYDINNILSFARVWTGFEIASRRGNNEELDYIEYSRMDTMVLRDIGRRDWFPKKDLVGGWLGDRYPLCADLPRGAFLKAGATYKLLGRSSLPRYGFDDERLDGWEYARRMTLPTNSNLRSLLCANSGSGCTYPSVVNIESDIACTGLECDIETAIVVQVAPQVFYEYVRRPCVHFAFFNGAKRVWAGTSAPSMCAHPSLPVATQTCCPDGSKAEISCMYHGEYVSFDENKVRCNNLVCPGTTNSVSDCGACCAQVRFSTAIPKRSHFQWTDGSCSFKLKVRLDGMAAIVHEPSSSFNTIVYVSNTVRNMNFFNVPWPRDPFVGDELFPTIDNNCGNETCVEQDDWTCLCDVTVTDEIGFSAEPADADAILSTLKVGAFEPELFGSDYATGVTHSSDSSITIYHKAAGVYAIDTIFKLSDEFGETIYLKNIVSNIDIGDTTKDYFAPPIRAPLNIRNPVSFYDLVDPQLRDAYYETDALIDHLISHQNTAPFVSKKLIQHLGISNPSPRFVESVATAFKTGEYTFNGVTFGDGKLSDLKATVAAILLDREATSTVLDADPAYGGIREPVVKVLAFMRAMGYTPTSHDRNIYPKFDGMYSKVGQMAHESPDQFSFFLHDYQPPGQFAQSKLNTPPSQVLTLSTTISTVEGFFSMVRNGLTWIGGGFGGRVFPYYGYPAAGDHSQSVGYLSYVPDGATIEEKVAHIADLLTSGRMSSDVLAQIVASFDAGASDEMKIMVAQQLIATSPEFHTTNLVNRDGSPREPTPIPPRTPDPYQAIVVLLLRGGLDSFNVLAPHSTCSLYRSFRNNRELLVLQPDEMLSITNNDPDQPCETFGVNSAIPIMKEIYDNGHGLFMANIGHLAKPVTKGNWFTETKTHLFSHTTMERECQLVDAFQEDGWSTGVLGRMLDVHQRNGLSVVANGIGGKGPIVEGNPSLGRTVDVIPARGINTLSRVSLETNSDDLGSIEPMMEYLNQDTSINSGIFANFWAQNLIDTINRTEYLSALYATTSLRYSNLFTGSVGEKLGVVSKMILKNEERSVNKDVFFLDMGGYDGHGLSKEILQGNLPVLNHGLTAFYREMTYQNMLDKITFVVMSEFGRTITPNSSYGSDHAWGGNAFVFGGQVKGGQILGPYPKSFDNTDETNIGRGRLIPSISWESMWYGIANWYGISKFEEMNVVIPNNGNFGCQLFTDKDMYTVGNNTISGCNDRAVNLKLSMFLKEPRYLTGLEQKRICKAAIAAVAKNANVTSRCIVVDQKIIVSYDINRRLSKINGTRFLQTTDPTYEVQGTVSMDYQEDSTNKTGSEYIENVQAFTADMNQELTGTCTDGTTTCETSGNTLDLVAQVNLFEADVSDSPSMAPSLSLRPSALPSVVPSVSPSKTPSVSPSDAPSNVPSESSQPSTEPTKKPSAEPSVSFVPSGSPTKSNQPSDYPSISPSESQEPSDYPSLTPSISPSDLPSLSPSESPSDVPSKSPSDVPSKSPSLTPSAEPSDHPSLNPSESPTVSSMPTPDDPSAKPSAQPSSRPSRDCGPYVPKSCGNGGLWSPYKCECLCVAPYCPNKVTNGTCSSTSCPADYHETLFEGCSLDCPWFKLDSSCASASVVPGDATAIYSSKQDCCNDQFAGDVSGCMERPAGFSVLKYNARFTFSGIDCKTPRSDRAAAAGDIAKAVISKICKTVPGLNCGRNDKIKISKICGNSIDVEANAPSSTRRRTLQASDDEVVEFTIILNAIAQEDLRQKDAILGKYFQGTNLDNLLTAIKNEILASSATQTVQTITSIYYEFLNSFISGLGLYYPAWGSKETCLNDGMQQEYMNNNPDAWLYNTLEACCDRYYSWATNECLKLHYEANLVSSSGTVPTVFDPTADLYYPDWLNTNTCVNDGNAPQYMKVNYETWMYETLYDCCKAYYGWNDAFTPCLEAGGINPPTKAPIEDSWYVDWTEFKCVKSCEGSPPCGGFHKSWNILHPSKGVCCEEHLSWKDTCLFD